MLDIARTHFHRNINYWEDENTYCDCLEINRGSMNLNIYFVDSKIMTMLANFFVKIEQVIFFPNTVIYKKNQAIPPEEETLSIVNKCTCYTSQ